MVPDGKREKLITKEQGNLLGLGLGWASQVQEEKASELALEEEERESAKCVVGGAGDPDGRCWGGGWGINWGCVVR